ncbi:hypothetical protein [Nesterenkonia sandarakina]|uniref:Uncharacterized protein n=1 Tax=Nesterenkonia sandarakina TaxID=272918 RepID=A0A7Z0J4A8_9MICC|nr:hypothetical protein [Nesterenkonia sandarakina]NYJ18155.1 hypothetical protein [Nesterenkonia sandarakina]
MRTHTARAGLFALALFLVGCGEGEAPDSSEPSGTLAEEEPSYEGHATGELSDPGSASPDDEVIEIGIQRLGCASGETGEIVDVEVDTGEDQIVIEAAVEPLEGPADCPGNEVVPTDIDLGEPIGDRDLVDGVCEHERAAETTMCDTSVRWSGGDR